ncbi:MAG: lysophospholipid acyltransferase family protein [candidate division WOR-3 bacterium]
MFRDAKNSIFWSKIKSFLLYLYGLSVRIRVVGVEKIALPIRAGYIVVANHLTGADSIVIQIALKTRIFFLAWARWFHTRFIGFWMHRLCDTMPVENGKGFENIATLRKSIELLKAGAAVGIYPEGELNRQGRVDHIHSGAAWLAVRARVPVLPVYVAGLKLGPQPYSRSWLNEAWEGFFSVVNNIFNRNIVVIIGTPILPPNSPPRTKEELRNELSRINNELHRQFTTFIYQSVNRRN